MRFPLSYEAASDLAKVDRRFLLSIVIPTFSRRDELAKLLDQLALEVQGHQDCVEILVSDNASSDRTNDLLRQYLARHTSDLAIRCFTQASNVGAPMNLHFLIDQSRSEYIWAMGDDDALVPGKIRKITELLRSNPIEMLLIRAEGIGEWERIPSNSAANAGVDAVIVNLRHKHAADYLFAGGFLGSVIIRAKTWRDVLPQVEGLVETCYANWAAVLKVASDAGTFHVVDEPYVRGNFNMKGESKIPPFNVLVLGRLRVWAFFNGTELQKVLKSRIKKLAQDGWIQIALGNINDVATVPEKLKALRATGWALGVDGVLTYLIAIVSIIFPFPRLLAKVKAIIRS